MNERSITHAPKSGEKGNWVEAYLPENQLTQHQSQPHNQIFDLSVIRGILFRQRWLVAGVILASIVAGLVMTLLAKPMYEAQSSVRIEPYGAQIVDGQDIDQGIASNQVYDLLSTHVAIIGSRDLANTVAEDFNLGERYDFLGADIDQSRPPHATDEEWREEKQDIAASILHESVNVEMPRENWVIEIGYISEDPVIAAEMANAYAAAFAASETRDTIEGNEYAQEYLLEQIDITRLRLQEAEQAANRYARNSGIILQPSAGGDDDGAATLTTSNLTRINARVSVARAARIEAEQRWRSMESLPAAQLPEVQNSPLLQGLSAERTAKMTELDDLRQRFLDAHPQIVAVLAQIETLDTQIERNTAHIKGAVWTEYVVARNQEQALQRELDSITSLTLSEQERQVGYGVLAREAQALQDQLQVLLGRYNEVSTAANVRTGTIVPLDSALTPESPYSPSLMRNLTLALIAGLGLAGGLVFLRETLDDKVRSLDEVEERVGLPLLGHTPLVADSDVTAEGADKFSPLMEAYASIRLTIDFVLTSEQNVIQVTSSQASEGKSTTSMILAELFARGGRKTLLVDADLRQPSLSSYLGHGRAEVGIVEVLLGHADLRNTTIKSSHENLDVLPVGKIPPNPSEILASGQFRDFIAKYREEYDLIVFDSAPMLGLADAALLAGQVDGTILVLEANTIQFGQARSVVKRLRGGGGNPIGAILTKYRALEAGESYDYQYAYYQYGGTDE